MLPLHAHGDIFSSEEPLAVFETARHVPQPTVSEKAALVCGGLCALGMGGLLIGVV